MANITLTNLPTVTGLNGTEPLLGVQSGTSVQITTGQIAGLSKGSSMLPFPVSIGGTGDTTLTQWGLLYGNGTAAIGSIAPPAGTNYVLVGSAGSAPSWQPTIPVTAGVDSISFGTTGLTPSTAQAGVITVAGTLNAVSGGTGLSAYTIGDLLYASTSTTLASLADVATGNALLSGGTGVAPSWGKVSLTTTVSGTLPIGNGGTGQATALTQYGVIYAATTAAMGFTAAGTTGQILVATTGAAPTWGGLPSGSAVTSITFGTTGLTPSTATTGAVTVAGTLIAANGGTGQSTYAVGDLLYASTTTALSRLADVATGSVLISGGIGVAPSYSSSPTLTGTTTSAFFIANGTITGSLTQGAYTYGTLGYSDTNIYSSFSSSVNSYTQTLLQNASSGTAASVNHIVSNNLGTASTYFGEFGMNSSGFTGSGSFNLPNAVYLDSTSGDLVLGTTTSNAIRFVINSGTTDAMQIGTAGNVAIGTNATATSNLLTGATITGGTSAYAHYNSGVVQSGVTALASAYVSNISLATAAFTTASVPHFWANPGAGGTGSIITNQYGFLADTTVATQGAATVTNAYGFYGNLAAATNRWNLYMSGTANNYMAGALGVGTTSVGAAGTITASSTISDSIGNVRTIVQNSQTSAYTLVATDNGKYISITTGGVTVPASIFTAGQNIVIYNQSSSVQTITQGASVTMTLAGSTTTGNRSLAANGVATVLCTGSNTFVITGQGLT